MVRKRASELPTLLLKKGDGDTNMIQQIIKEKQEFEQAQPGGFPDFAQNQPSLIDIIDNYWISKFRDGPYDNLGLRKCFYNIVQNPTEVAAKMIDIDTKNIRLVSENGQSSYPVWFLKKELDIWMKENQISKLFNKMIFEFPKYGSVVLKKAKEGIYMVPIQNLILADPTVDSLEKTPIIEYHQMTPAQLRKMKGWKNIDEAIDKFGDKIDIYERSDANSKTQYIIAGLEDGVELYSEENVEPPYKELHWERIPGRWLGRGQVERLFETQIHQNQVANYKRQGLLWTSKHIYWTDDDTFAKNLTTEVDDGEVIRSKGIYPLNNEERNLSAYREEEQRWDALAEQLTFSYDLMRGERSPAGTPLGTSVLQSRMAGGFFDLKKEELGIFLKDVMLDWVLPDFKRKNSAEHTMQFFGTDEELERYENLLTNYWTNIERKEFVKRNNAIPNQFQARTIKMKIQDALKKRKEKYLTIPTGFYDNIKYKVDVVITDEQVDVASKLQTFQTIFQIIGSNPTVLKDKLTKRFFFKMIELAGISPAEFQELEEASQSPEEMAVGAQRGGSLSKIPSISPTETAPTQTKL